MTALIRKDFYVLRKALLFYVVAIAAFQALPTGMVFISVLYAILLPSSAFAYDDRSKWDMMELMLPYSTRQIILSRYCIGWIAAACCITVGGAARLLLSYARPEMWGTVSVRTLLAELALALCFLALSMPVYFRFDAEHSRVIRTFIVVLICGVMGGLIGIMTTRDIFSTHDGTFGYSLWLEYLLAAALTAFSIPLSELAWKRRHR